MVIKKSPYLLIEKGADINKPDTINGLTPLLWAFDNGKTEIALTLIEKGANINFTNNKDQNIL
jgi:ankyrin repeat protein